MTDAVDTDQLVSLAAGLDGKLPEGGGCGDRAFEAFVDTLRGWIVAHYDLPGTRAERVEKTHLLLHLMLGAPTLEAAIRRLERFRMLVWGDRAIRLMVQDDDLVILFRQPLRQDVHGLVSDLWSLSFLLTEFEFLVGGPLAGVTGRVRQTPRLPSATAQLLFGRPFAYEAAELALVLPRRHLGRPVVAQAGEIDVFLERLVPRTIGAEEASRGLPMLVAGMIEAAVRRSATRKAVPDAIAAPLGISVPTLRRRLLREGTTFRDIRHHVLDALAREWLGAGLSVVETAERLGYSDAFAFRRAFRRRQHCSPTAYRRAVRTS